MTICPDDYEVQVVVDRPSSGQWHCGPNPVWVTVTHIPTMVSARAYHRSHRKARDMAMACVEMMVEDALLGGDQCSYPEALADVSRRAFIDERGTPFHEKAAVVSILRFAQRNGRITCDELKEVALECGVAASSGVVYASMMVNKGLLYRVSRGVYAAPSHGTD